MTGLPGGAEVKSLPASAGDAGSVLASGICPEVGNGKPFQYSCPECSTDGEPGALQSMELRRVVRHD